MKRKVIQFCYEGDAEDRGLVVLCDDGTMWKLWRQDRYAESKWTNIELKGFCSPWIEKEESEE